MANRRFSGGNTRSGRSFPQQFQSNSVSPWQGGAAPSNSLNSGLLSQLAAPQAQLALALTSLLQNQQQPNPPSLLSLNTSPALNNQDGYGSQSRFTGRGRDFRRPEPYSKNRNLGGGNWRPEARGKGSSNRTDFRNKKASPLKKSSNKAKDSDKNEKVDNESSNKQSEDVVDISLDENRDEDGTEKEKKRDWKEEKKSAGDDAVDLTEEQGGDDEKKKEQGVKRVREGRYQGVPSSLLHCFVCTKSMWDGESFQNHLRGKAHKQMMDSLIESFQITVNILRENMRLAEEKKMIELERFNRSGRTFHRKIQEPESHCNMCDLKFLGKIIAHRKSEGHQRLKRFLHPSCAHCNLEFPSRVEWVEHRFTREHLKKLAEMDSGETGKIIEEDLEMDLEPLLEESLLSEDENPVLELDDDLKDLQNRIPSYKKNRAIGKNSMKPANGYFCEICDRFVHERNLEAHQKSERHYYKFVDAVKAKYKTASENKETEEEGNWKRRKIEGKEGEEEEKNAEEPMEEGGVNGDGNEMYDPEEACKENNAGTEEAGDEKQDEDELLGGNEDDNKETTKAEEEEEEKLQESLAKKDEAKEAEAKQEEKAKAEANSPRVRRSVGGTGGGQVKNGAGPKSKTRARK